MGKSLKLIASIAIAAFAPYAAAALGLKGFAATAFGFALQLGANAILGAVGGDSAGGGGGVSDSGFLLNQQGNNKAIDIVYGTRRIGGTRVYIDTTDVNGVSGDGKDEYLHQAIAVCQGGSIDFGADAIKGITAIYFNDRLAWSASAGIDPYYDGLIDIRLYNGSNNQTYTAPDVSAGPGWAFSDHITTGNHDGRGVVWAYIIMKYNRDKFPGAPTILFDVEGKKIRRVDTMAYTDDLAEMRNPANVLYDYLTNARYGKGLDTAFLDTASFNVARQYCFAAGLTIDGAVQTSQTIFNNTNNLLAAANCNLVFSNGVYKLVPMKAENFDDAFVFDESNIVGEWNISLGSKKSRFNTFIVNYFNPDLDWNPDSINIENAQYLAADNGTINQKQIDLPYTSNKELASKVANYYLNISRYQTIVNFTAVHTALQLEVGDPVYVTHTTPGWTNKKFRVLALTLSPDATVDVTLAEYAPDEYYLEAAEPIQNIVQNGDFAQGTTNWYGNAAFVPEGQEYNYANVLSAGNPWDVNLSQGLEIVSGNTYRLTFRGRGTPGKLVRAGIGLAEAPWNAHVNDFVMTADWQEYTLEVTANFGSANSRVLFDIGANAGEFFLDDVVLQII